MKNLLVILFFILLFIVVIFISLFYRKKYERSLKKTTRSSTFIPSLKEQQFNPDINTNNWDLHKQRLQKFKRSQYKGLTFFVSSQDRIYYLSEKGIKIYC